MNTEKSGRGYDDTPYLKAMGRGIMEGDFTSVEQAARSVLGESGGSNVDRLRRKFRQEGWFIRSRDEYVRGLRSGPEPHVAFEGHPRSCQYTLRAAHRFWSNPIKSAKGILFERYHDHKANVAELLMGFVLVPVMLGLLWNAFLATEADRTGEAILLLALLAGSTAGFVLLLGEAQVTYELYASTKKDRDP